MTVFQFGIAIAELNFRIIQQIQQQWRSGSQTVILGELEGSELPALVVNRWKVTLLALAKKSC